MSRKTLVNINLEQEMLNELDCIVKASGLSRNYVMRYAIKTFLENQPEHARELYERYKEVK